jgi:hypothetical protein
MFKSVEAVRTLRLILAAVIDSFPRGNRTMVTSRPAHLMGGMDSALSLVWLVVLQNGEGQS